MGEMDEIRISNKSLYHHGETYGHYREIQQNADSNTVLLLRMDEGSGSAPGDASRHFFNINLRTSPNRANYIIEQQPVPIVYNKDLVASLVDKKVTLSWETSLEIGNQGFEIQRSLNQINWKKMGWVDGKGNSKVVNSYSFEDDAPEYETNYYRLKQQEFNGRVNYSNVDSVYLQPESELTIYPNPSSGFIKIQGTYGKTLTSVRIYDLAGKELNFNVLPEYIIDVSKLSRGLYILKIDYDNKLFIDKFFVDRE